VVLRGKVVENCALEKSEFGVKLKPVVSQNDIFDVDADRNKVAERAWYLYSWSLAATRPTSVICCYWKNLQTNATQRGKSALMPLHGLCATELTLNHFQPLLQPC